MSGVIHECTVCEVRAPWSEGWAWYGSYTVLEGYKPGRIIKICSPKCLSEAIKQKLIPKDAEVCDEGRSAVEYGVEQMGLGL